MLSVGQEITKSVDIIIMRILQVIPVFSAPFGGPVTVVLLVERVKRRGML